MIWRKDPGTGKVMTFEQCLELYIQEMPDAGVIRTSFDTWEQVDVVFDSTAETMKHMKKVSDYLMDASIELLNRAKRHDTTKLGAHEKPEFDRETPILSGLTYGSPEYKESLQRLDKALKNHYRMNSHHPEYYQNGIVGMNLFDIVEMFFDWKAAGERNTGGNIADSIEKNKDRFGMGELLPKIFMNTAKFLGWVK